MRSHPSCWRSLSSLGLSLLLLMALVPQSQAQTPDMTRRTPTVTTLTQLPPVYAFPRSPLSSDEHLKLLAAHKLSTYPPTPSTSSRVGKFRSTGLFSGFVPTEAQIKIVAQNYDLIMLNGYRNDIVPRLRQYNPAIKVLLYFDAGLSPNRTLTDASSVDAQNLAWLLANHPEWFLHDAQGHPLQATQFSTSYWLDPANTEWQDFFAQKLNKTLALTGQVWDGVLIDQFLVSYTSYRDYAGTPLPVEYTNDQDFQEAQLAFLRRVTSLVNVPLIPNVEAQWLPVYPEFFSQAAAIAGGIEAECFVMESATLHGYSSHETIAAYLHLVRNTPPDKIVLLNSPTAPLMGDVDWTLYTYFVYLLVADRNRELYWTFKENWSQVPHYWYKEFDLDLGAPLDEMKNADIFLWKREFTNATVVVNTRTSPYQYEFTGTHYDVLGRRLTSPLTLAPHTGQVLMKGSGAPRDGSPDRWVGISTDRAVYRPGDAMDVRLNLVNPTPTQQAVDLYLSIALPSGAVLYLPDFGTTPVPVAADVALPPLLEVLDIALFTHTFSNDPGGDYTWSAVVTTPGADVSNPANWLSWDEAPFMHVP